MEIVESPSKAARRGRFYYGWVVVLLASLAMVGTLPGRTQGLGLVTEPLLKDLRLDREAYAVINLWATLIGSLFCLGVGRLMDRVGVRPVLTAIAVGLGVAVIAMSGVHGIAPLFILITLIRGLGQSALSVVSIAMIGYWFKRRINTAMAVYSLALSIGFVIAFVLVEQSVRVSGWRTAWAQIGWALLLVLTPVGFLLAKREPRPEEAEREGIDEKEETTEGYSLQEALRTPAFWVMGFSSAVYGLIASGIALFNESVLAERGFDRLTYRSMLSILLMTGLLGNFLGGWLATKWKMNRLMSIAMLLMTVGLLGLTVVSTKAHVTIVAAVMGLAGGFVTVLFFAFWRAVYGTNNLGQIQGAAQTLTVLASAVGPLVLAACVARTGSYAIAFYALAVVVATLGVAAWIVRMPMASSTPEPSG